MRSDTRVPYQFQRTPATEGGITLGLNWSCPLNRAGVENTDQKPRFRLESQLRPWFVRTEDSKTLLFQMTHGFVEPEAMENTADTSQKPM